MRLVSENEMVAVQEIRKINGNDLRNLCIKENWFTCGNNEEYSKIFDFVYDKKEIDLNDIQQLAIYIYEHSEMSHYTDYQEMLQDVMYKLNEIATNYFELM